MKRKVNVTDLTTEMFVEELDRPWLGTPFPLEGVYLQTQDEIRVLQRLCNHVFIDTLRGRDLPFATVDSGQSTPISMTPVTRISKFSSSRPSSPARHIPKTKFIEEISRAKEIYQETEVLVETMHDDIRHGRRIDSEGSELIVEDMVESVMCNPDALLWLTYLNNRDHYTALHSMNVCALSLVFGHYLGLEEKALQQLGVSALLHDIGKLRVPLDILNKPDKLSNKEFELMQKHPSHGLNILLDTKDLPKTVLEVAHSHHERVAGGGYPRGVKGKDITFFSKITSIVDVYDALTSDRVYRDGMPSPEAMKLLSKWAGQNFDAILVEQFIKCMGMFPSGSLVELRSGEVGVVIPPKDNQRLKPILMLMLDRFKKRYYPLRIIDYRVLDEHSPRYQIKKVLPNGKYGINPIDYAQEISAEFKKQTRSEL